VESKKKKEGKEKGVSITGGEFLFFLAHEKEPTT